MSETLEREIRRLKEEMSRKREAIQDIGRLINREIDRDFHIDLWELSDRELDQEMGDRLSRLNDDIDTRPSAEAITSHRQVVGKFIVRAKRLLMKLFNPYTNTLLEKQRRFNDRLVAFHLATFIRLHRGENALQAVKEKLEEIEESQEVLLKEIKTIRERLPKDPEKKTIP